MWSATVHFYFRHLKISSGDRACVKRRGMASGSTDAAGGHSRRAGDVAAGHCTGLAAGQTAVPSKISGGNIRELAAGFAAGGHRLFAVGAVWPARGFRLVVGIGTGLAIHFRLERSGIGIGSSFFSAHGATDSAGVLGHRRSSSPGGATLAPVPSMPFGPFYCRWRGREFLAARCWHLLAAWENLAPRL